MKKRPLHFAEMAFLFAEDRLISILRPDQANADLLETPRLPGPEWFFPTPEQAKILAQNLRQTLVSRFAKTQTQALGDRKAVL